MLRGLRSLLKVPDRKREHYFAPTGASVALAVYHLLHSFAGNVHSLVATKYLHRCLSFSICQCSPRLKRQMLYALSNDELDTLGVHTAGLYPNNDVDLRKLKKLIQAQKLAPCFPGADSDTHEVSSWLACLRRKSYRDSGPFSPACSWRSAPFASCSTQRSTGHSAAPKASAQSASYK